VERQPARLDPSGQDRLVQRVQRGEHQNPREAAEEQRQADERSDTHIAEDERESGEAN
jgi:hypothetical protein